MGSYISFINSMLGLRQQKLDEEIAQQKAEQAEMEAITSSLSSLGSSIGGAVSSYSKGTAANKLMNQASPPRAEAVMPGTTTPNVALNQSAAATPLEGQIPYSEVPVTASPATGGEAELKMRMAMDDSATSRLKTAMAQKKIDDDLAFKKSKFLVEQARKDTAARDKKFDAGFKNTKSYISEMAVFDDGIAKATTPLEYDQAVKSKLALNQAAIDYGMKVDPISPESIPPFESGEDKLAREAQEAVVAKARSDLQKAKDAPMGASDTFRTSLGLTPGAGAIPAIGYEGLAPLEKDTAIATAQKKYEAQQSALREIQPKPGVSASGPAVASTATTPGATKSSSGMQTISSQEASAQAGYPVKPGTTLTDKYGNKILVQ